MALERLHQPSEEIAGKVAEHLFDAEIVVQQVAARALGKIGKRLKLKEGVVIDSLTQVARDGDPLVKRKAEKALRKIGVYS